MLVHDFPTDAEGKAIPYGVYDMARNEAWVSVGWDHDTPAFAVASIRHWWHQMGCGAYPEATTLFITADAGGSNGYRLRAWKHELQQLADETGLTIEVSHFPPGTSKWNKIEHRLFCHITANWRGTPLTTYETIVDRIGNVRTATGLRVRAELDAGEYPTGVTVTKEQMDALALVPGCGIRLSRSRHLMPALRPRLAARLVEADPASRRQAGDWDSNPGSRLPRQRCSRIAGFNHPAIPSNTVRFPPPADHAVPNPRSGLAAHPNPRRRALLNHLQPAG